MIDSLNPPEASVHREETSDIPRLLPFLSDVESSAADEALLSALNDASPDLGEKLLDMLLTRNRSNGLEDLVQNLHTWPNHVGARLTRRTGELSTTIRKAMERTGLQGRLNAISLIREGKDARLAYLLVPALSDEREMVCAAAAECLAHMAGHLIHDQHASTQEEPTSAGKCMREALLRSLEAYDLHGNETIVETAMRLAPFLCDHLDELFPVRLSKIRLAALSLFQRKFDPDWAGFAYMGLACRRWRESLARSISERARPAFLVRMIREATRVDSPSTQRGLKLIRRLSWLRHGAGALLTLPRDQMTNAVRFLLSLGIPNEQKTKILREMVMTGPPAAQLPALEAIVEEGLDPSGRIARTAASWGDPELARIAERGLRKSGDRKERSSTDQIPGAALTRSNEAHGRVFDAFWERQDRLSPEERLRTARATLEQTEDFGARLSAKCRSADPTDRSRAARILRGLNLQTELTAELMQLARDPDPVVRSESLQALSGPASPSKKRILIEGLQDADARVQANAVEGLDRLGCDKELLAMTSRLHDPDSRLRANLVRAHLRVHPAQGGAALLEMLESVDRSCRISALWVAQNPGTLLALDLKKSLAARLEQLVAQDADPRIRERGKSVLCSLANASGRESFPHSGVLT